MEWCLALQDAEDKIGRGSASEAQLRAIIGSTMAKITGQEIAAPTVREWFKQWLDAKQGANAPVTLHKYSSAIDKLLQFLGQKADGRLESVSRKDIIYFRKLLQEQGKTPTTINQIISRIIAAPFSLAFRQGLILHNPIAGIPRLTDPSKRRKQAFDVEDVRNLLAVAEGDWKGAILCGYSTGMRLSDVANLSWENVDFGVGVIAFNQRKTQSVDDDATIIGLHPDFEDWLRNRKVRPLSGPIFPKLAGSHTGGGGGLSSKFGAIMRKAGIESVAIRERQGNGRSVHAKSFHSFRHSAATHVFKAKVIEEAQKRVTGHARGQMVRHYTHVDIPALKAATSMIPRLSSSSH